jgi:hypothetical protein
MYFRKQFCGGSVVNENIFCVPYFHVPFFHRMCKTEDWFSAPQAESALSFFEQGVKLFSKEIYPKTLIQ